MYKEKDGPGRPFSFHLLNVVVMLGFQFCRSLVLSFLSIYAFMGVAWGVESLRIYRCGDSYSTQMAPQQNCKLLKAANVTVFDGAHAAQTALPAAPVSAVSATLRSSEQRSLDDQAHAVLQVEFQRAQSQQGVLLREWNNGEPQRRADEFRQPQKYQNRVAEMRLALQRVEADIAGLTREMSRVAPLNMNGAKP